MTSKDVAWAFMAIDIRQRTVNSTLFRTGTITDTTGVAWAAKRRRAASSDGDAPWKSSNETGFTSGRDAMRRSRTDVEARSEEHTSELQSPCNLVCRLLLEKKKAVEYMVRSVY